MAHQVAERLTVQGIRQTRGYKSNLLKKQRQEAAKAAAEAAAKAAAAVATTASPKGKVFEIIFSDFFNEFRISEVLKILKRQKFEERSTINYASQ